MGSMCCDKMKINGNNKIIFYLTSLSICFFKISSLLNVPQPPLFPSSNFSTSFSCFTALGCENTNSFLVQTSSEFCHKNTDACENYTKLPSEKQQTRSISYMAP